MEKPTADICSSFETLSSSGRRESKKLPFRLDRQLMVNFADQLVEGVRQAVEAGYYRAGDVLPPQKDIARLLGVSIRIPREAYKKLAEQRIAAPRKSVGCVILPSGTAVWRGRLLFVVSAASEGSYFQSKMIGCLRQSLSKAGWLLTVVTIDIHRRGRSDTSLLDAALVNTYDLAVVYCLTEKFVSRPIEKHGIPTLFVNDVPPLDGKPRILSFDRALDAFVGQCHARGVKSVLLAEYWPCEGFAESVRSAGLSLEVMKVRPPPTESYLEETERRAFKAFFRRFAAGRPRPDLILCSDDYVARGALTALAFQSVRIPQDVRFVTLSNRGHGPVAPVSLTRLEVDPRQCGETLAKCILARTRGEDPCSVPLTEAVYVVGDSF